MIGVWTSVINQTFYHDIAALPTHINSSRRCICLCLYVCDIASFCPSDRRWWMRDCVSARSDVYDSCDASSIPAPGIFSPSLFFAMTDGLPTYHTSRIYYLTVWPLDFASTFPKTDCKARNCHFSSLSVAFYFILFFLIENFDLGDLFFCGWFPLRTMRPRGSGNRSEC